jgi:hypothetical protein
MHIVHCMYWEAIKRLNEGRRVSIHMFLELSETVGCTLCIVAFVRVYQRLDEGRRVSMFLQSGNALEKS